MQDDKNAACQMRFPQKLWYLLNLRTEAILWGGTGRTILLNYRILHNYLQCENSVFKTANISSFIRQLNLYGFRKVTSHLQDPVCNSSNPYMHEYIHDYFQSGRPDLLNKITRKALTVKRTVKPKNPCQSDQYCFSALQKARLALRIALKNAAQGFYFHPTQHYDVHLECEDDYVYEDEEKFQFDWLPPNNDNGSIENSTPVVAVTVNFVEDMNDNKENPKKIDIKIESATIEDSTTGSNFRMTPQSSFMDFSEPCNMQNSHSFQSQFLSMPDLDSEPPEKSGVELLTEFNSDHEIEHNMSIKLCGSEENSLNCVLPSVSTDQSDEVTIIEDECSLDQYNGEWDQMFNDMMNRGTNQDGSELKELYSQISKTIELFNS